MPPGFEARQAAVRAIAGVLEQRRPFEDVDDSRDGLEPRDRAFARLIAATVLRRHGELAAVLKTFLTRPLPDRTGRLWPILLSGTAQLLALETPAHAAISLAVDQCRADQNARHFAGLANAVLRRVATEGPALLASADAVTLNIPSWMLDRWTRHYGEATARSIGAASLAEAPLDLGVKGDAVSWTERLSGSLLPTGSIRLSGGGRIADLPGYAEGEWWVQDAAAALPVLLLGDVKGRTVADLCAAPGGKTAQLAAAGATVVSVEQAPERAARLEDNLARLKLHAEVAVADVGTWSPGRTFDAVLLDAPCTSTGTIRRHPDILHLKRASDLAPLVEVQSRLLANAATLVATGGLLVYCSCSLEPEEGEQGIAAFLAAQPGFERVPLAAGERGIAAEWISPLGDLRTLPFHQPLPDPAAAGLDGFFACRLRRLR
ncbi:MAG: RsmB/NOP family class I SAM-dependent RNA methyltransferase [Hyphomicrobium sp.]